MGSRLADLVISSAFGLKRFSSLGSKTDPILQIQYPMPWRILAHRELQVENAGISENLVNWRGMMIDYRTFFIDSSENRIKSIKQVAELLATS